MSDKQQLRDIARAQRRGFVATLDPLAHRLAFKALPTPLARLLEGRETIALYVPLDDEAPALRFAPALLLAGKTLLLPAVLDRLGTMEFRRWSPDDILVAGHFGTSHPEPDGDPLKPDAIFTPLLGFDAAMSRLGQGGGYYDRAFARYPDALRIGLGWSVQQFETLPADPWDQPLDAVLTEVAFFEGAVR